MMNWISLCFSNPFGVLAIVLAAVNLALSLFFLFKLITRKGREQLTGMDHGINSILMICLVMVFFTLITPLYDMFRASLSLAEAGTGDPRVIFQGLIEYIVPIHINLAVCSFFLIVWFLLRAFHRLKLEKAGLKNE